MNLLEETIKALGDNGYELNDIAYICSLDGRYHTDYDTFSKLADFDYDDGFGSAKVATDLCIVLDGGSWLERYEYDGSEGWVYKRKPTRTSLCKPILKLTDNEAYWPTVSELNQEVEV